MKFYDAHVHLADLDVEQTVRYALETGTAMCSAGVDLESSAKCLALGKRYSSAVLPFVGIHPSEAEKAVDSKGVRELAKSAKGIGEIGLDPGYSSIGEGSQQMLVFRGQLRIADALRLPIQVHTRGAEGRCLEELERFSGGRVLLHWFEGEELLGKAQDRGYFVSFGPAILYSKKLQRMASASDGGLILAESDGPVPFKPLGGASGPMLVPSVVMKLAEVRRASFEETSASMVLNAEVYLGRKGKG